MIDHLKTRLKSHQSIYLKIRALRGGFRRIRYGLRHAHSTSYFGPNIVCANDLIVGEYAYIGTGCRIGPKVQIGAYTMLGPDVAIVGADHRYDLPGVPIIFSGRPEMKKTVIGKDVWCGGRSILMAGVRIGDASIIAAGSVVTKDVPPFEIYGGNPARRIGSRFLDPSKKKQHEEMLASEPKPGKYCAEL